MTVARMQRPSANPNSRNTGRDAVIQSIARQARGAAILQLLRHVQHTRVARIPQPEINPGNYMPRMDMYDDEDESHVHAMLEMPGVRRDQVHVRVEDGKLVVDGHRASPLAHYLNLPDSYGSRGSAESVDVPRQTKFRTKELKFGQFHREIEVPPHCKNVDIITDFTDGMLLLSWPRTPVTNTATGKYGANRAFTP